MLPAAALSLLLLAGPAQPPAPVAIALGDGGEPLGLDDLGFDPVRNEVLVPAAQLDALVVLDARTLAQRVIGGFGASGATEKHRGPTTVDVAPHDLLVGDRDARAVILIDRATGARAGEVPIGGVPDYVRFVAPSDLWATEPAAERIEVRSWSRAGPRREARFIAVPGGPESLVIDAQASRAYTQSEGRNELLAFDLGTLKHLFTWPTGCPADPRGLALDASRHWLFAACKGGRVSLIDTTSGKIVDQLQGEPGVDIIDFDAGRRRLYLPGAKEGQLVVVDVSAEGKMKRLGTLPTAVGAHCVVSDRQGKLFVCDPRHGRILVVQDSY